MADDDGIVSVTDPADQGAALLALYDRAVPQVYGYLLPRCGGVATAEDLTAETFLAAVSAVQRGAVEQMTIAWLVRVARNKLVDHWRRQAREQRKLALVHDPMPTDDPWDERLDVHRAHEVLAQLGAAPPGRAHPALPRRPVGARGGREPRPHRPRHRGPAGAGPHRLPPRLRGE